MVVALDDATKTNAESYGLPAFRMNVKVPRMIASPSGRGRGGFGAVGQGRFWGWSCGGG